MRLTSTSQFSVPLLISVAIALILPGCNDSGTGVDAPLLQVNTSTTGTRLDPDGYDITIDGGPARSTGINGSVTITDISPGNRSVQLSGTAANCQVEGENPRTVTVSAGATAVVDFSVICSDEAQGAIEVSTSTTGQPPDPDGFTLILDGAEWGPVGATATATLAGLSPGDHTLELTGIASECRVQGANPRTVTVSASNTTPVAFSIICGNVTGRVTRWTPVDPPVFFTLMDIWGSGPADLFTVGFDKTTSVGTILHYNGSTWSEQLRLPDIALQSVWGSSPNDVFAVGSHISRAEGAILHYDGAGWTEMVVPNVAGAGDDVIMWRSVWGSSRTDVYAVGARYGTAATPTTGLLQPTAIAARYNGSAWTVVSLPQAANRELLDVWGTSDRNIYAVGDFQPGDGNDEGIIQHFNGTTWSETRHGGRGLHLKAVWATAASDVFTVGDDGVILHFDGAGWTPMPTPITKAVHEIWGSSPTDVIAVAARGIILHYDGTAWSEMVSPTDRDLFGVWGSAPGDVWATGVIGEILHGTP